MSSQFYPGLRATVADGTQRKPSPQIHTVVICAALGLQKADFGERWLMCWRLLIPCFITTCGLGTNDGFVPEAATRTSQSDSKPCRKRRAESCWLIT
jgi:hypothetical protein